MSLIKCSECEKEISDQAKTCPNCGCPIIVVNQFGKKKDSPLSIIAILLAIFLTSSILSVVSIFAGIIDIAINNKQYRHMGSYYAIIWTIAAYIIIYG